MMESFFPLFGYLLGSIPFGLVLSNFFGSGNLRDLGSKNIGATNVLRTQGKLLGGATFFLDFLKGFAACYFFHTDNELINLMVMASPVIGHMFPVWLKFKGGKGVATFFGVLCAMNLYTFLIAIFVWIAIFMLTKISSIAGLTSIISSLGIFALINQNFLSKQLYILIALAILIVARHHENIKRLLKGSELSTKQ